MGSVFCWVQEFLEADAWPVSIEQSGAKLRTSFPGTSTTISCLAWAREQYGQFVFYAEFPSAVPFERRADVAEFITRVNFNMVLGAFQLDFTTGALRLKVSSELMGTEADKRETISRLVYFAAPIMDLHHPFIQAVVEGRRTPQQAFDDVETSGGRT